MIQRRTALVAAGVSALAALALALPNKAFALDLSGKTVTWIVPFKEGGGSDTLARLLQPYLQKALPGNPNIVILNQPGGGSIKSANNFHRTGKTDGTEIFIASSSTFLPFTLQSRKVKYDPNAWRALVGLPRGTVFYADPAKVPVKGKGADIKADVAALRSASLVLGAKAPTSIELIDLTAMELIGAKVKPVFGLSTSKQRKAFLRGEVNINHDGTGPYLTKIGKVVAEGKATPLFSYGYQAADGSLKRDPDVADLPRFDEVLEAATGKKPSGPGFDAYVALMNNKVSLSKVIALAKGTPDNIVQAYIKAFKDVTTNPEVIKKLKKSVGSLPLSYGADTAKLVSAGTKMSPEARAWLTRMMKANYGASL